MMVTRKFMIILTCDIICIVKGDQVIFRRDRFVKVGDTIIFGEMDL